MAPLKGKGSVRAAEHPYRLSTSVTPPKPLLLWPWQSKMECYAYAMTNCFFNILLWVLTVMDVVLSAIRRPQFGINFLAKFVMHHR